MNTTTLIPDPHQNTTVDGDRGAAAVAQRRTLDTQDDHRPGFVELVRIELRKMRDTRSATAILATIAASAILIPVLLLIAFATGGIDAVRFVTFIAGAEVVPRLLMPVLVILLVASEWSQRSAMTTFALVPDRGRVLSAKLIAALAAMVGVFLAVLAIAALANLVSPAFGNEVLTWNFTWTRFGTYLLTYLFEMMIAFAFASALLNSAAALVAYYFAMLASTVVMYGLSRIDWLRPIVPWIDPVAMATVDDMPTIAANWQHLGVVCLVWIVTPLAIGVHRVLTTEIK